MSPFSEADGTNGVGECDEIVRLPPQPKRSSQHKPRCADFHSGSISTDMWRGHGMKRRHGRSGEAFPLRDTAAEAIAGGSSIS